MKAHDFYTETQLETLYYTAYTAALANLSRFGTQSRQFSASERRLARISAAMPASFRHDGRTRQEVS